MKKIQPRSKGKNKGFYIAMGVCLIALATAVYIGITTTMKRINEDKTMELNSTEQNDWVYPDTEDVGKEESDVPVESQVVSEQPAEESALEEQAAAAQVPSFMKPLEGEVLNAFSNGELVKSKTLNEWRTHDGVDLKAAANTPVKAAADGTVEDISEDTLWGVCVTVTHTGGYTTYYRGLKPDVEVKKGQNIAVGEVIGAVGNTAEIEIGEESHLHFAMKLNDEWIDPMSVMES